MARARGIVGVLVCLLALTVQLAAPDVATALPTPGATTTSTPRTASVPAVIGHRGAPGYRPEHTLEGYDLAVRQGADAIEPDLVMTRDGVLVARHETQLAATTDVASHPEFADRRTTRDGATGWFVQDFTLTELRTLRARERWPALRTTSATYDGRFGIPTFEDVLALRASTSARTGRTIAIVPELKGWAELHAAGLDPEAALVAALERSGLNTATAPVWTQSAQWTPLVRLRGPLGHRPRLVLVAFATGGPSDLAAAGTPRSYADMLAPAGLVDIARTVDAVAVDKSLVLPRRSDGRLGTVTRLPADARAAGLSVLAFTFRAENQWLPSDLRVGADPGARGRLDLEARAFYRAGVAGLFCDHPDLCRTGRLKSPQPAGRR